MCRTDNEFTEIALQKGMVTREQVRECKALLQEGMAAGSDVSIEMIFLGKGYLGESQVTEVKKFLFKELGGYEILAKVGSGGMGSVYQALQVSLGKEVALKVLPPDLARDEEFLQRFEREARSLAKLNHRNIVRAIDFGRDKEFFWLSMEYVPGKNLRKLVYRDGRFEEMRAIDVAIQVCHGLDHAYRHGMVHRDIKPENILLTDGGVAKITDFGLARKQNRTGDSFMTRTGFALGTPLYMSPEQVQGLEDVDTRSDLYSLGCTLFFLLAGDPPFDGSSDVMIMTAHLDKPAPDIRKIVPTLSLATARIIRRLMAKDPHKRYQTPAELLHDLERVQGGEVPFKAPPTKRMTRSPSSYNPAVTRKKDRTPLVVFGVVVVMLALFAYFFAGAMGRQGRGADPYDEDPRDRVIGEKDRRKPDPDRKVKPEDRPPPPEDPPDPKDLPGKDDPVPPDDPPAEALLAERIKAEVDGFDQLSGTDVGEYSSAEEFAGKLRSAVKRAEDLLFEVEGTEQTSTIEQIMSRRDALKGRLLEVEPAAFEEIRLVAEALDSEGRLIAAIGEMEKVARLFSSRVLRDRASGIIAVYQERLTGGGDGPEPPLDPELWTKRVIQYARERNYDEILPLAENPPEKFSGEVAGRVKDHALKARHFLELASVKIQNVLAMGDEVHLTSGENGTLMRLDGETLVVEVGEGTEAFVSAADLKASFLEWIVVDNNSGEDEFLAAGYFHALEGDSRSARKRLIEGGVDEAEVGRILSMWQAEEPDRVPPDRPDPPDRNDSRARDLWEGGEKKFEEGKFKEARKSYDALLEKHADSPLVKEKHDEIEARLFGIELAEVPLEKTFSGRYQPSPKGHKVTYRPMCGKMFERDWNLFRDPPYNQKPQGFYARQEITFWRARWADFTWVVKFQLTARGTVIFRFRESERGYYAVRIRFRPGDDQMDVVLCKRVEGGDEYEHLEPAQPLEKFISKPGTPQTSTLVIGCEGKKIKVRLNNDFIGESRSGVEDDSFSTGGLSIDLHGDDPQRFLETFVDGSFCPDWEKDTRLALVTKEKLTGELPKEQKPLGEGMAAKGYHERELEGPVRGQRFDPVISKVWRGDTIPMKDLDRSAQYSIRWKGWLVIPEDGLYQFRTRSEDGLRLKVGDETVIEDWELKDDPVRRGGELKLERGLHKITLELQNGDGHAMMHLFWERPGALRELLDGRYLYYSMEDVNR